jgi:arsenite-transporting ATPase
MRILLFTGKGGVGKTTTAAATALRCADAGLRTLVMSTDPAHSLGDAFGSPLGPVPTAETIRFLSLPDILAWYMERLFPVSRRVNKAISPVLKRVTSLPVAGDGVFAAGRRFYERLDGVRELLTDPAVTSVRLVVNPERMVIAEARRTYTYLSLFGYRVDAVVANRMLPDDITDPWFKKWRELHAEHLATIESSFAPLPVLRAELAADELVGPERLREFGEAVYGDLDQAAVLHEGEPLKVTRRAGAYHLTLQLPFADHDDLDVGRKDDELLVRVGPYRRAIVLPDSLRRRTITDATLRQGKLRVVFAGDEPRR